LFAGGLANTPNTVRQQSIDYVTIDTAANAGDFGDLLDYYTHLSACANESRATFTGGDAGISPSVSQNVIQYVIIDTPGNSTDLGDLTTTRRMHTSTSGAAS